VLFIEGSSERSLSSKIKLYDVARSSLNEAKEDFEDIIRQKGLAIWDKNDSRLAKLKNYFERFYSNPSCPPAPSCSSVLKVLGIITGLDGAEGLGGILNYERYLLIRCGYLLDLQINAVEEKHKTEGGYTENLHKKRVAYIYSKR